MEDLKRIAIPDTLENDKGQLRAMFYLDDLKNHIEKEKLKMMDKTLEDIIRYANNNRIKVG